MFLISSSNHIATKHDCEQGNIQRICFGSHLPLKIADNRQSAIIQPEHNSSFNLKEDIGWYIQCLLFDPSFHPASQSANLKSVCQLISP